MNKRDPEATRNTILDASESLFLEAGFADTSMSAVAKRAGVTKSLIHHHFGSKEELYAAVKTRFFGEYFDIQRELLEREDDSVEVLRDSFLAYFRALQKRPGFARLQCWMYLEGDEACSNMGDDLIITGIDKIRRAQDKGFIREDVEAGHVLVMLLSLVEYWFLSRGRYQKQELLNHLVTQNAEDQEETYLKDMLSVFFQGLAKTSKPEKPS